MVNYLVFLRTYYMKTHKTFLFFTLLLGFQNFSYAEIDNKSSISINEVALENSTELTDKQLSELEFKITENIQINPYSIYDFYLLAKTYLIQLDRNPANMNKIHATSEISQHLLDLNPNSEYGYIVSAEVMRVMGYDESAKQLVLETMDDKYKTGWRSYLFLAEQEPLASAEQREYLKKALAFKSVSSKVYQIQASLLIHDGKMTEAIKLADKVNDPLLHISVANKLREDSYSKAERYYLNYYKAYSKNPNFLLSYYSFKSGANKLSRLDANKLENLSLQNSQKIEAYKIIGKFYLNRSKEKANEYYSKAMEISESPVKDIYEIKREYISKNSMLSFIDLLDIVKRTNPGISEIYALQAETISEYKKDLTNAITVYSDAILLDPYRSDYYTAIGLVYYKKKSYNKALKLFSRATKINPMDATAFYNKACMNSILGSKKKAIDDLAVAFELDPSLKETAIKDSDLRRIKNSKIFLD